MRDTYPTGDRANMDVPEVDVPAVLALAIPPAGEVGHGPMIPPIWSDGKPLGMVGSKPIRHKTGRPGFATYGCERHRPDYHWQNLSATVPVIFLVCDVHSVWLTGPAINR